MSGLSYIDIFLRLLPEAIVIILAGYALSEKKIDTKMYLFSSAILALLTYVYKILPITPALPMLLTAITTVIILVFINKIKVVQAIISTVVCYIVAIFMEGVNIFIMESIFNINTYIIFQDSSPLLRNLYGLPSLFLFAAINISYYFIARRLTVKKYVTNE